MQIVRQQRSDLQARFLGPDIPRLWCPPLTHYQADGSIDRERITAHQRAMHPEVDSFMAPGSTSDGWELSDNEVAEVVGIALDLGKELGSRTLVAALRPTVRQAMGITEQTMATLRKRSGCGDGLEAMEACGVCGFVVCGPSGAQVGQEEILDGLAEVLNLGLPMAVYQLPQITQNRIAPETFTQLAAQYPNLIMFKDSSGEDQVALADQGESGVYLVRGAEGGYDQWARESGGPYAGFLLSTANCFGVQLQALLSGLEQGELDQARAISKQLTLVIEQAFDAVSGVEAGNAFTNANKAIDHFMAHGPEAADMPGPMLHAGVRLGPDIITKVGKVLAAADLMPAKGYMPG